MELKMQLVPTRIKYLSLMSTTFATFGSKTRIYNHKNNGLRASGITQSPGRHFLFQCIYPRAQSYLKMSIIYVSIHIHFLSLFRLLSHSYTCHNLDAENLHLATQVSFDVIHQCFKIFKIRIQHRFCQIYTQEFALILLQIAPFF